MTFSRRERWGKVKEFIFIKYAPDTQSVWLPETRTDQLEYYLHFWTADARMDLFRIWLFSEEERA